MAHRKSIGIRRLKNEASRVVNEVREREAEYVVTRRGEPVAVLRPLTESEIETERERQGAARVERIMKRIRDTAKQIGPLPEGESAESVVSKQRR